MNTRRILWLSLLILDLLLLFFIIPVDIYERNWLLFGFLGAGVFFASLFMFLGDFESVYELFEKVEPGTYQNQSRKLAPFAVFPAFILLIVMLFYHIDRKSTELEEHGVLTKGRVIGGESTTTRRNFSSNTSYSVNVLYEDSLHHQHSFEGSVDGGEFNDLYQGAIVDVVYSKMHPGLAKVVLSVDEISKIKNIPHEKLLMAHLMAILEGKVKKDSVLDYLNSINYEWIQGAEKGYYKNDKLQIAIKVFPEMDQLSYVEKKNMFVVNTKDDDFESSITKYGFKKKASNTDGKPKEFYYNDKYLVAKEQKMDEYRPSNNMALSMDGFEIYHIAAIESLDK